MQEWKCWMNSWLYIVREKVVWISMSRNKTCIICWNSHVNSLAKTCSLRCQSKHERLLKIERKEKEKVKKEKIKTKKAFSRSKLIAECDRLASMYVRERDRGKPCITCGSAWKENYQNWHFQSRRHLNVRWFEKNMNLQCPKCNLWWSWEQYKHWVAIDKLYWVGTAEWIMRLANDSSKTTDEEILMHIRYYYWELSKMWIETGKKIYLTS